jgi:DNA (cytosine-5)-methyltransferase 1
VTYADKLAELWRRATAEREPGAPTVVSTFAGMGGSTIGYLAAGFADVLAAEWDDHAAACLRQNFTAPVYDGDIHALDPGALPLAAGELDLLDGSPPCQGFSRLGHRREHDPRNELWRPFVRLAEAWQPRALVIENVVELGSDRRVFPAFHAALEAAGYSVAWAVLPAQWFGAATVRKRLIGIGVRADLGIAPTHPPPSAKPVTVAEAWRDLPPETVPLPRPMSERMTRLAAMTEPGHNAGRALSSRGGRPAYYSLNRLTWTRPAVALTSLVGRSDLIHPVLNRFLTVREMTRLQSIPDEYAWPPGTSYEQAHNRIGNSVAPLLAFALGCHVRKLVGGASSPGRPEGHQSPTRRASVV